MTYTCSACVVQEIFCPTCTCNKKTGSTRLTDSTNHFLICVSLQNAVVTVSLINICNLYLIITVILKVTSYKTKHFSKYLYTITIRHLQIYSQTFLTSWHLGLRVGGERNNVHHTKLQEDQSCNRSLSFEPGKATIVIHDIQRSPFR